MQLRENCSALFLSFTFILSFVSFGSVWKQSELVRFGPPYKLLSSRLAAFKTESFRRAADSRQRSGTAAPRRGRWLLLFAYLLVAASRFRFLFYVVKLVICMLILVMVNLSGVSSAGWHHDDSSQVSAWSLSPNIFLLLLDDFWFLEAWNHV